jgi:nucleotide-binding universal stress UspA family protein
MTERCYEMSPSTRFALRAVRHNLETSWTAPLRAVGVTHRCPLIENDSPAAALLAVAERERVGLVVVGAHGGGSLADRFS